MLNALTFVFFALGWLCPLSAQTVKPQPPEKEVAGTVVELFDLEQMPLFPGDSLGRYLSANLHYPAAAKQAKAGGIVPIQFVIDETGRVSEVKNIRTSAENPKMASRQDLIDEALRVVMAMPHWTPGYKDGKPVACRFTLPIKFRID